MSKNTIKTVILSVFIIIMLMAVVLALKAPAADLNMIPDDYKSEYIDSTGLPYFSEMDSYYNFRLTQNYVDHGYVGDKLVDNSSWDMHRMAPDGNKVEYELGIVYVTSWLHDFANTYLGGNYSLKEVAFWAGAIVSTFAVIPAFIFARRLTNNYGAIVATLIIVLAPNYFAHTYPGFFDTDMFYYIFSLFFIFFFVESIRAKNIILKVLFALLAIVSIGLFSKSWTGYIFYVGLMGIFSVVYLVACYFFNVGDDNQESYSSKIKWFIHQRDVLSIVILGIIGFVGLALIRGVDGVIGIFSSLIGLLSLQSTSTVVGGFPNVLISVAEMQIPSMLGGGMNSLFLANTNGVVNGIGGMFVFLAGLVVLYVLVRRSLKLRNARVKTSSASDKKPHKSKRLSSAKKIDDERKFKLSLGKFEFGSSDELLSNKRITVLYTCLFIVWVVITALAVVRGSRFITTFVLPFALMTGMFVGFAMEYIKNRLDNDKWIMVCIFLCAVLVAVPLATLSTLYGVAALLLIVALGIFTIYGIKQSAATKVPIKKYVLIAALIFALITPSVCGAYQTSQQVYPGTSDAMWNAMSWVNETQPDNTVITSWWDFGYLFEEAADRQVTFDGGSQSGQRAFWLGKAMTTDDLELSAGIFRMLDTSGDRAVDYIVNNVTNTTNDNGEQVQGDIGNATDLLIDILPMSKQNATNTLKTKYNFTAEEAKNLTNYTHPANPRPVIFVASSDMLQKAGWWTYFGAWDFENQTSENYNYYVPTEQVEVKANSTGRLPILEDQGMTVNVVITRGAGNNSTTAYVESVYTDSGEPIMVNGSEYNPLKASNMIVIEDGYLVKNETIANATDGNYTIFLMGENNQYTPILMSNELANSMFTRLYLLGGSGQNIFENVHNENGVMLFKVNFDNTVAGSG